MKSAETKRRFEESPNLTGIDPASVESLRSSAEERTLTEGEVIYEEDAKLDSTFGMLLSGELAVEQAGETVGTVREQQIFGEMAYFSHRRTRNATIRVISPHALVLKFNLSPEELGSPGRWTLRRCLATHAMSRSRNPSPILIA